MLPESAPGIALFELSLLHAYLSVGPHHAYLLQAADFGSYRFHAVDCIFVLTMASLQELEAQLATLKQQEASLLAEAKKEKRKQKLQDNHVAQVLHDAGCGNVAPKLAKQAASELLLLLELSGFYDDTLKASATEVVASFALGKGRPQQCSNHKFSNVWDKSMRANISAGVELLYIHSELVVPGEYHGPDAQMTKLCKYVIEHRLFFWLLDQSCRKGVLPGTSSLLTQAAEFIPATAPEHVRTGLRKYFLNTESTTARHWVESYQARWDVERAIEETGQDVDPSEGDFQVALACFCRAPFLNPWGHSLPQFFAAFSSEFSIFWSIFGPSFGSQKWSQKWAPKSGLNRILNKATKLGPILGSKNGPQNWPRNLHFFWFFFWNSVRFFLQCFEPVVRQQHICSGPNLLGPLATRHPFSSIWMKLECCWVTASRKA